MAFGGAGRRTLVRGDEISEAADAISAAMQTLSRLRQRLDGVGAPLAATYVEGACDALSFAIDAALWTAVDANGVQHAPWVGSTRLRLEREGKGVYAGLAKPVVVAPPSNAGRSLGADLASSATLVKAMRADEVAAGLMATALAHSDWIHLASGEVFSGDPLAARAVVATVVGRTSFPAWTRRQMDGLIHRGSADGLATLGWRRMTGAALPTA